MRFQMAGRFGSLQAAAACLFIVCCAPTEEPPAVEYSSVVAQRPFSAPVQPGASTLPGSQPAQTAQPEAAGAGPGIADDGASGGDAMTSLAAGTGAMGVAGAQPSAAGNTAEPAHSSGAGGAGGMNADTAPEEMPSGPAPTMLTFAYTTRTQDGEYAPDNVGAVWVEDASGKWIHTLEYWGNVPNGSHLSRYSRAGGPDYGAFFGIRSVKPPPDTITSATLHMHKSHTGLSWDLKDKSGADVPDGMYKLVIELTEEEAAGEFLEIAFMKGPEAAEIAPPDTPYYTGMTLTLR